MSHTPNGPHGTPAPETNPAQIEVSLLEPLAGIGLSMLQLGALPAVRKTVRDDLWAREPDAFYETVDAAALLALARNQT